MQHDQNKTVRRDFRYYDLQRHWTKKIEPHLGDEKLNAILERDFGRYVYGRWEKTFDRGQFPREFESCDWDRDRVGRTPRYWRYVKHGACHWLVNFNLRIATLAEPSRPWRILTSKSTRPSGTGSGRCSTSTSWQ